MNSLVKIGFYFFIFSCECQKFVTGAARGYWIYFQNCNCTIVYFTWEYISEYRSITLTGTSVSVLGTDDEKKKKLRSWNSRIFEPPRHWPHWKALGDSRKSPDNYFLSTTVGINFERKSVNRLKLNIQQIQPGTRQGHLAPQSPGEISIIFSKFV